MPHDKKKAPADAVRTPDTAGASRVEKLGLSHLFMAGSKSRAVAERLLTGEEYTRKELGAAEKLATSSVTRVVDVLQEAGVQIRRDRNESRDAVYQAVVADQDAPGNSASFNVQGQDGPLVKLGGMEMTDNPGEIRVRLTSTLGTTEGVATMVPAFTELSRDGLPLNRVTLVAGGAQDWMLGTPAYSVIVRDVVWVS